MAIETYGALVRIHVPRQQIGNCVLPHNGPTMATCSPGCTVRLTCEHWSSAIERKRPFRTTNVHAPTPWAWRCALRLLHWCIENFVHALSDTRAVANGVHTISD